MKIRENIIFLIFLIFFFFVLNEKIINVKFSPLKTFFEKYIGKNSLVKILIAIFAHSKFFTK